MSGVKLSFRPLSTSSCLYRHKPKPVRDPTKRNFTGEKLQEYLQKREQALQRLQPYKDTVAAVRERFRRELQDEERRRNDAQGETMKRELAEKQEALKNMAVVADSNQKLAQMREEAQRIAQKQELEKIKEKEELALKEIEEERKINMATVLRLIEESKDFITPENLDERIEHALSNEVNFNYAITPQGEKLHSNKPPGNLDNWTGASPAAYATGGIRQGSSEWDIVFKDRMEKT